MIKEKLITFITENGEYLIANELDNHLIIHLYNLLYQTHITKSDFMNVVDKMYEIKTGEKTVISLLDDESEENK